MAASDADLVRRVRGGDSALFATLVERHHQACLRYAVRMLREPDDAEDAVQDTFVRAYGALDCYEERGQFKAWLFRILVNRCRSVIARRQRQDARFVDVVESQLAVTEAESDHVLRERIDRAVGSLSAPLREAFLMKHVEDLSYDDMSRITGVGISALKMRVNRACDSLRQELNGIWT